MQAGIEDDENGPGDNIALEIDMDELGEDIGTDDDLPHYVANAAGSADEDNEDPPTFEHAAAPVTGTRPGSVPPSEDNTHPDLGYELKAEDGEGDERGTMAPEEVAGWDGGDDMGLAARAQQAQSSDVEGSISVKDIVNLDDVSLTDEGQEGEVSEVEVIDVDVDVDDAQAGGTRRSQRIGNRRR